MDFSFSDEQRAIQNSLSGFLGRNYDFESRRKTVQSRPGFRPAIWQAMAQDLGILGAAIPETFGGLGGSAVETMIIMEELGAALAVEPYLETVVMAAGLLRQVDSAVAALALSSITRGEMIFAVGWAEPDARYRFSDVATTARADGNGWRLSGHKSVVTAAPWASRLIVTARTGGATADRDGISLFMIERDHEHAGLTASDYPTIDGRWASDIVLQDVLLPAEALLGEAGNAIALIERMGDEAIAAICAEALGVMRRMLQDTVDYTSQRRQFGQALAGFQVLQHRMVDMFMQIEMATSATYLATLSLHEPSAARARAVSAAKVTVGNACRFVGQNAIQLHGGMGMTDELAVSHYFKRATVIEAELGTVDYHLARFAELSHEVV